MASGGSGPPLPPSEKSDKGKGKKSYVVKLMERFNNEIGSSSQPTTTPTSTSTSRSVPSPLQVPGFTSTPHTFIPTSLPSPLQVPGLTPTPYQVPTNQMASLSANVGSNPSTPTNIAPSLGTVDADPHSSSAANDVEECSNSRPMITGGFEKVSKRDNLMKKSLMKMNEKMDEIIENYAESSASTEESIDKDGETE
ncbi:hypothetical protein LR48_Vigan10g184800 [Vigna angularis]|uniref:Uncharacterized protein n=1 Tax=Phaseolus angularis TaxID=3914 RepID=A0A0L9VLP3_PHAAN|nr:hypothetical protein LR48_Vigan10g184800 [Vigna angularis]